MAEDRDELGRVLDDLDAAWFLPTEHERPEGLLYHYTHTRGFRVWATDYRLVNDRREMVCGEDAFKEDGDLLSQWRAYSADGAGFSIGFDQRALPPPVRVGGPVTCLLVRCRYGTDWLKAFARALLTKLAHEYVEAVGSVFRDGDERRLYSSFVASGLQRRFGLRVPRSIPGWSLV